MLSKHHLPQLIPNRIDAAVRRLAEAIWVGLEPIPVQATPAGPRQLSREEAGSLPLAPVEPCSFWGRLFDQRWCRIALPESAEPLWLNWRDQGEATLYIDGQPWFGFDVGHRHCRLPKGAREAWIESNCIQSAIWHPDANGMGAAGSYFEGAFLCHRDEEAWGAYHDLKCLLDLAFDQRSRENPAVPRGVVPIGVQPTMEHATPALRRLMHIMDDAVNAWDIHGIAALRERLADGYAELRMDKTFMRCVLTGHAHIDLVWMWPERVGELKAVHTFSTVNRLMETYPEFRFAYSQTASYEAVQRRAPGLYKQVQRRIGTGQWQATGAMYVEADTLLACGEALARNLLIGQQGFAALNGKPSPLVWLPDAFGYTACMPQIMQQTGVRYFYTTKVTWSAITPFPYSSFVWKAQGAEVVVHVTHDSGYNTFVQIPEVKACVLGHRQGDIHHECLLPTGYGDGGGGPTEEICERARRLGSLPGMPELAWDQPEAFFERLDTLRGQLPVHHGECYLECHQGTYTTHSNLKAAFRGFERALQTAEAAACATGGRWEMERAWKRLVFAQFHDYIPGSSAWDVYMEGIPELQREAGEQIAQAQSALQGGESGAPLSLFNPHGVPVERWISDPATGEALRVTVPPLAGVHVKTAAQSSTPAPASVDGPSASNGIAAFTLDASGCIGRIEWEGVKVPLRAPLGQLVSYPDHSSAFDAWNLDRHVLALGQPCDEMPEIEPVREGCHRAGFRVTRRIGTQSRATITYTLEAGSPLLHLAVDLDWQEPEMLLKMLFPTRYAAASARFGAPFGSILRPQMSGSTAAEAMWEVPFSRYFALFDEGERNGLFVVTEAKYGVSVRDGVAGLSLLRSPRVTGMDNVHGAAWPAHLSRLDIPSPFSDIGTHTIRLAIGRHDITLPRERQPASLADTLFTEPLLYRGGEISSAIEAISGGETLVPCWAKPAGKDAWILRFHEVAGMRGAVTVTPRPGWKLSETNLGEHAPRLLQPGETIPFTPYQIVSVRFEKA